MKLRVYRRDIIQALSEQHCISRYFRFMSNRPYRGPAGVSATKIWDLALAERTPAERRIILEAATWLELQPGLGRYIIPRLKQDRFLRISAMRRLFPLIAQAPSTDSDTFWNEYKEFCKRHVLKGGRVWR